MSLTHHGQRASTLHVYAFQVCPLYAIKQANQRLLKPPDSDNEYNSISSPCSIVYQHRPREQQSRLWASVIQGNTTDLAAESIDVTRATTTNSDDTDTIHSSINDNYDVVDTSSSSSNQLDKTTTTTTTLDDNNDDEDFIDPQVLQRHARWIVLVDDEEAIRVSVGQFLFDAGYQVTACADADALWQVINSSYNNDKNDNAFSRSSRLPDAIISDIRMPASTADGLELTQQIRKDPRTQYLPVILLTAKSLTRDRVAGYRAGANQYLAKPFAPQELLTLIDNVILRKAQMSSKSNAGLLGLKQELDTIKLIMQQNAAQAVQQTDVYLTPMERQTLEFLGRGYTNAEIAKERQVHVRNVVKTVSKLYEKTSTRNRTELVKWGLQTGYIARNLT